MKYLLSCFSDNEKKIWFNSKTEKVEEINDCQDDVMGYYDYIDGCLYAYYSVGVEKYFYNGEREIEIENDIWARFTNVLVDRKSIFEIFRADNLVWDITYQAWWRNMEAYYPDEFVVEAREEDIEYDFFAYVESRIEKN